MLKWSLSAEKFQILGPDFTISLSCMARNLFCVWWRTFYLRVCIWTSCKSQNWSLVRVSLLRPQEMFRKWELPLSHLIVYQFPISLSCSSRLIMDTCSCLCAVVSQFYFIVCGILFIRLYLFWDFFLTFFVRLQRQGVIFARTPMRQRPPAGFKPAIISLNGCRTKPLPLETKEPALPHYSYKSVTPHFGIEPPPSRDGLPIGYVKNRRDPVDVATRALWIGSVLAVAMTTVVILVATAIIRLTGLVSQESLLLLDLLLFLKILVTAFAYWPTLASGEQSSFSFST